MYMNVDYKFLLVISTYVPNLFKSYHDLLSMNVDYKVLQVKSPSDMMGNVMLFQESSATGLEDIIVPGQCCTGTVYQK